jgi:hypothetical protein
VPCAGVALYSGVLEKVPLKRMLLCAMLLGVGLGSKKRLLKNACCCRVDPASLLKSPLAGVALYNGVFKKVPLKRMLLWAMLLGVGLGSTQLLLVSGANRALGLSDELFVLGDSVILTVLGQVCGCVRQAVEG